MGFQLKSPEESYLWRMYQFYKKGISPREFKRIQNRDINSITQIEIMVQEKERVENEMAMLRSKG